MQNSEVHMFKKFIISCLVFLFFFSQMASPVSASSRADSAPDFEAIIAKYQQQIPLLMAEQGLPGLAIAVTDESRVLWVEGFGFTDTNHKVPITPETIFSIQSASKVLSATAVLAAVQEGLVDLDVPITTYIPDFTVHSIFETNPERMITLRRLLSHTAGFTVEAPVGNNYDMEPGTFEEHIRSISDTWLRFPVGTGYAYSNLGVDLAGYILQKVSGKPFADYVQEHVLQPIGMDQSSFDMDQIRTNADRAIGHSYPQPRVPLVVPMIPSGGFYSSAADMARFIQFELNRGSINGQPVLAPTLIDEMYTIPAPSQGSREGYALGVAKTGWYKAQNTVIMSHGGGGFGFLADLWWLPDIKLGITILTNSADHNLQGSLALQILYDFSHEPGSVYAQRLLSLPPTPSVTEGDGHFRPPAGLAELIASQAQPPSDGDLARWQKYVGYYGRSDWDVIDPQNAYMQIYITNSSLFLQVRDTPDELKLTEVAPGLFFASNGEALDLRGRVFTWRNIKLIKTGQGPVPWQKGVLWVCALFFLAGLLWLPVRGLVRLFRRAGPSAQVSRRWRSVRAVTVLLSSLGGLASIGLIFLMPLVVHSGFLGWMHLPFWVRALMHGPFVLLVFGGGFLAITATGWKNHWPIQSERIFSLVLAGAVVAMIGLLGYWHMIGFNLG